MTIEVGDPGYMPAQSHTPSVRVKDDVRRFGRYHILSMLGEGGMGEVRLAYDPVLERKVALKTLRPQWRVTDSNHRNTRLANIERRLKREARSLARLEHPNIVEVLDVGVRGDSLFVAMEYVGGRTLRTWGEELDGALRDWREVARLMIMVGRALARAHQQGVVHRDFKPENVVVGDEDTPHVIDFGIAFDAQTNNPEIAGHHAPCVGSGVGSRLTVHGHVVGTPAYMAPEQRDGKCGPSVDQFAYCVSFFELIYGQRPFKGTCTAEELVLASQAPFVPARHWGRAPGWLYRLLAQGLADDPARRYDSMTQLCDALEAGLARWQRRWWYRAWAGLLVGLMAALVVTDVVSASMLIPEDPCPNVRAEEWRGIWDEARMADIESAMLATGLNYAAETWGLLKPRIEERVENWVAVRDLVCEETWVEQSAASEDLDLRMACLKVSKARHTAWLDLLADADKKLVRGAFRALSRLPPIEDCTDAARLRDDEPWPDDPEKRAKVAELRGALGKAVAAGQAGRYAEAGRLLQALQNPIAKLDFPALNAELALLLGADARATGDRQGALLQYTRASEWGQAAGHRRIVVGAQIWLMFVHGYMRNDMKSAQLAAERAESALEGMRKPGHARGLFFSNLAILHGLARRYEQYESAMTEAVDALRLKFHGRIFKICHG